MNVRTFKTLSVSALAAGLLLGGSKVNAQVTYTFTTTNNSSGTTMSSGTNTLAGQTGDTSKLYFTNTPDFTNTPLQGIPSDNIVPFTVIPHTTIASGSTTSYNTAIADTFNLDVFLTSNGVTKDFAFTNLTLTGNLIYNGNNQAYSDTAVFGNFIQGPISQNVGGSIFSVALNGRTNPGNPNGATPNGTIGGVVINTQVPEPGSIAMMVGMGISGCAFLTRRRKAAK